MPLTSRRRAVDRAACAGAVRPPTFAIGEGQRRQLHIVNIRVRKRGGSRRYRRELDGQVFCCHAPTIAQSLTFFLKRHWCDTGKCQYQSIIPTCPQVFFRSFCVATIGRKGEVFVGAEVSREVFVRLEGETDRESTHLLSLCQAEGKRATTALFYDSVGWCSMQMNRTRPDRGCKQVLL